jgi:hypothetical protein
VPLPESGTQIAEIKKLISRAVPAPAWSLGDSLAQRFLDAHEDLPNPSKDEIKSSEPEILSTGRLKL